MAHRKQLFTSDKKNWTSPALVLDRVRLIGPIGLDPCHGVGSIVGARLTLDVKQDGLTSEWPKIRAAELAYTNWPYGAKENKAWARKVVAQLATHPEQLCLAAARTSEIWLQDVILPAEPTAIGFFHKRLKFSNSKMVAPFPSLVIYFGKRLEKFVKAFEDVCWIVVRPKRGTYPIGIHRTPSAKPRKRRAKAEAVAKKPLKVRITKKTMPAVRDMLQTDDKSPPAVKASMRAKLAPVRVAKAVASVPGRFAARTASVQQIPRPTLRPVRLPVPAGASVSTRPAVGGYFGRTRAPAPQPAEAESSS